MIERLDIKSLRHEFVREFLGKIVIGLFLAIAIRNTAAEIARPTETRVYELKAATVDALDAVAKRSGRVSVITMSNVPLKDAFALNGDLYSDEDEAVAQLQLTEDHTKWVSVDPTTKTTILSAIRDRLIAYHDLRGKVYLSLILALFLQTWHLYYTFRTFDELIPNSASTPKYAQMSPGSRFVVEGLVVLSMVPLGAICIILALSSPQNGSTNWLFWGIVLWCSLWFVFDVCRYLTHLVYRNGRHRRHPKVYRVYRWSPYEQDTKIWLFMDCILLAACLWLYYGGGFDARGFVDYRDVMERMERELLVLILIICMGIFMLGFEIWRSNRERAVGESMQ